MDLNQLKYFVGLSRELHFSRAAKLLHITQPALSRQISNLERELGVSLFERGPRAVRLTEAGQFLQPKAVAILMACRQTSEELRIQFGGNQRPLQMGFLSVLLDDLVAPSIRSCRLRHPRLRVQLHELSPSQQMEKLAAGELDLAVLGNINEQDRRLYRVRRLSYHPMAAVVSEDHPLSQAKNIHLAQLAKEPWISLDEGLFPGRREFLRKACRAAGFEPLIAAELESLNLLLAAVSSGEGVAILPRHSSKLSHRGCVFLPLQAPVPKAELLLLLRLEEKRPEAEAIAVELEARAREVMR